MRTQYWSQLLSTVELKDEEGFTSPLGFCESAESQAKPLYGDAESQREVQSLGPGNHWQYRADTKSADASEKELNDALNLL